MLNKSVLHKLEDVTATLSDFFVRPPTQREADLAEQLRGDLRHLADASSNQLPFWKATCEALMALAESSDPRYFKRWQPIGSTMVARTTPYAIRNYRQLRRSPDWKNVWAEAIAVPQHGRAPPFLVDPRTDAITVQHATNLRHYESVTGRSLLSHDCVVEFGGGYGSMCRLMNRLGFTGRYVIFDQPPILALQRYYLGLHGLRADYATEGSIVLCRSLAEVAEFMQPGSALMSTWALSEMPLDLRAEIEMFLHDGRSVAALLAYQKHFEGVDNAAYFQGLQERSARDWTWHQAQIDPVNAYVVGSRREGMASRPEADN
ncbi:hypothetical protein [Siccirubricoccus sp. G192]|uniref:hypothetical protein n=1 Tax=Siccirubricoccus sp. G192 TaxID=2849651 RepID=UPI001C2C2B5D|nr:hypothetical protein [Siccirubricoccus sp. G192]MBV1796081.1 hypothetical protein [Siccirubricoccus sp. G192]